jgi:hypothetical protein
VTLIAAFRCDAAGRPGLVLCADTQETVGDVRVAVNKLSPQDWGHYQLAIAGSGNGDLIEAFAYTLGRTIASWPIGAEEGFVRETLRDLLIDFHQNEVRLYPADSESEKFCEFLVCVKPRGIEDRFFLWQLRGPTISPVGDYALIGISAAIYTHELGRLYRQSLSMGQAVLLAIHLLSLAKATSNYVGGETDIVVLRPTSLRPYSHEDIQILESRIQAFNRQIAKLVLACPDHNIPEGSFRELLGVFDDELTALRNELLHPHAVVDSHGVPITILGQPVFITPADPSREPPPSEYENEDEDED